MSLAALEQSSEPHLQYQRLGMNLNPDAYLSVAGRAHPHNIFVNPRLVQQTSNLQQIPNPNPLLPSAPSASSGSSSHQQSQQLQTSKPSDSSRRSSTASSSVGNNSSTNINNNNNNNNNSNNSSNNNNNNSSSSGNTNNRGNNNNSAANNNNNNNNDDEDEDDDAKMTDSQNDTALGGGSAGSWQNPAKDVEIRVEAAKRIATIFRQGSKNRDERREYRVLVALEHLCYRSAETKEEFTDPRAFEILLHRVASEKAKRRRESGNSKSGASFQEMLNFFLDVGSPQVAAAAAKATGLPASLDPSASANLTSRQQHMQRMRAAAQATDSARRREQALNPASASSSSSSSSSPTGATGATSSRISLDPKGFQGLPSFDKQTLLQSTMSAANDVSDSNKASPQSAMSRRSPYEGPHLLSMHEEPTNETNPDRTRISNERFIQAWPHNLQQMMPTGNIMSPFLNNNPAADQARQDRPGNDSTAHDWNVHEQQPSPVGEPRLFSQLASSYGGIPGLAGTQHAQDPNYFAAANFDNNPHHLSMVMSPRNTQHQPLSMWQTAAFGAPYDRTGVSQYNAQQQQAVHQPSSQDPYQSLASYDSVGISQSGLKRNFHDVLQQSSGLPASDDDSMNRVVRHKPLTDFGGARSYYS